MNDISELLKEAGIVYELDKDGDYGIKLSFSDGRTQLVFVCGKTSDYHNTAFRQIYSCACLDINTLDSKILKKCLENSNRLPMGGWELCDSGLIFCVKTVDNLSSEELYDIIKYVAVSADEFEKHFLGESDLL